jgi:hypothetical protein
VSKRTERAANLTRPGRLDPSVSEAPPVHRKQASMTWRRLVRDDLLRVRAIRAAVVSVSAVSGSRKKAGPADSVGTLISPQIPRWADIPLSSDVQAGIGLLPAGIGHPVVPCFPKVLTRPGQEAPGSQDHGSSRRSSAFLAQMRTSIEASSRGADCSSLHDAVSNLAGGPSHTAPKPSLESVSSNRFANPQSSSII